MKTITIPELHAETGRWVRAAKHARIRATRRGKMVAELAPLPAAERPQAALNTPAPAWMPAVATDSTHLITVDRNGRYARVR